MAIGVGMDAVSAHASALRMMKGLVTQQALVIAFEKTFHLTGLMMLALLPLAYFLRDRTREGGTPQRAAEPAAMAGE